MSSQYVIVWEFRIQQVREAEFVEKYGPEGVWARFFRGSAGYIRTELVRDVAVDLRFLTLDYWQTEHFLTERKVPLNYSLGDLQADSATLNEVLGRP